MSLSTLTPADDFLGSADTRGFYCAKYCLRRGVTEMTGQGTASAAVEERCRFKSKTTRHQGAIYITCKDRKSLLEERTFETDLGGKGGRAGNSVFNSATWHKTSERKSRAAAAIGRVWQEQKVSYIEQRLP